jgi:SAM-dependent methyltransferase
VLKLYKPDLQVADRTGVVTRPQACDLCGDCDVELLSLRDRRRKPLPTAVCVSCGLISHFQIPSDAQLGRYYRDQYRMAYHREAKPSAKRVVKAWACGQTIFKLLEPFARSGDRVFEVGAGLGCTVKAFQLAGYDASGVEPGAAFSDFAREQLQSPVATGQLEEMPLQPTYDLILLVHVIEHFQSPRRSLQFIHGLLRPDGQLYVECPNVAAPHAAPHKLFHFAHIYNFTYLTLNALARSCGFRVVHRFSDERDRNLRVLLARDNPAQIHPTANGYAESVAAVTRYNALTYHLRPRYLSERLKSVGHQLVCSFRTRQRLQDILGICRQSPTPARVEQSPGGIRKAA